MVRAVVRNVVLALIVGLPVLITSAAIITWALPPTWANGERMPISGSGFAGGFAFWYIILALPATGFALVHQLVLISLTDRGRRALQRADSVWSALALSLCVAVAIGVSSTEVHWTALLGTLLLASAAYASLVALPRMAKHEKPLANERLS